MRPLLVAVCILVSSAVAQNHFDPNGDPFHNFEQATAFDKKCQSNTGSAAANSGSSAQNTTKNNFSAALPATDITIDDLASLQRQVATKIPESSNWGRNREPHDRTPLQRLSGKFHEGMAVRLTAYVFESHYAD